MPRIVILTDIDIIEGIIGMLSLAIAAFSLGRIISAPRSVIGGMAFVISWISRKIGVNIFLYLKKKNEIHIKPFTYNMA
jgi:hypothetical protein